MNTDRIREVTGYLEKAAYALKVLRNQRAMLGTSKHSCKGVSVTVSFECNGKHDFASPVGIPGNDMMGLALCKAWDELIAAKELDIARHVALLQELSTRVG